MCKKWKEQADHRTGKSVKESWCSSANFAYKLIPDIFWFAMSENNVYLSK